jgi:aminoglycoside 6'-N-acetyltransferase
MTDPVRVRPLRREDLPLVGRWLAEPLVARWWDHRTDPESLERDFGAAIDGAEPTEVFLAAHAGTFFGLIQRYRVDAYPEYLEELAPVCAVPADALSIDYLIGEPDFRGRGLGAQLIRDFVADSWSRYPEARCVLVPVAAGNPASWKALEAAGFVRIARGPLPPDNPIDPPDSVIYLLHRPAARDKESV